MNNARCTDDGAIYTADNFSRLFSEDLEWKRRLLQCPECGGPAFFRNASLNGRGACFGARPHAHGCGMAAQDYERLLNGVGEGQDALQIPRGKIVVDFGYGSPAQPEYVDGTGRASRIPDDGYRHDFQEHRRPSTLLRLLIGSPAFRNSDSLIEVHEKSEIHVRDLFVPLLSVTDQYLGLFRGFWGLLSGVGFSEDQSTLWFNSGGLDTISFCLDTKCLPEFTQRYRVRDEEDIAGAYVLVFGTLKVSPVGKLYCAIEDLDFMALRLT